MQIPIKNLTISPFNVRKTMDKEMEELKDTIKSKGIIEPLIVRKTKKGHEIVVGQMRFLAAKSLGLKSVPCEVKQLSDKEAIELSLIENLQRTDLDSIDVAEGLKKLYDFEVTSNPKLSVHQFAIKTGKILGLTERQVESYLSLVNLAPELKEMVSEGKITIESGAKLKQLPPERQVEFVEEFSKMLEKKPIMETEEEELVDKVRERPEEIKRVMEEKIAESQQVVIIFKFPEGKSELRMQKRYFDYLGEKAEMERIDIPRLLERIIMGKLKEWGYKI